MRTTTVAEKDLAILRFLRDWWLAHWYGPSIREITRGCRFAATSITAAHLDKLELLGLIDRPGLSRAIRPTKEGTDAVIASTPAAVPAMSGNGVDRGV